MNARPSPGGIPGASERWTVVDRSWDRAWSRCSYACLSAGVLSALLTWGWFIPTVVVLVIVVAALLVVPPCLGRAGAGWALQVLDTAVLAAVGVVGAAGLVASSGAVGVLVLLLLTLMAPAVRRAIRELHASLRATLVLVQEGRAHSPSSWRDDGW